MKRKLFGWGILLALCLLITPVNAAISIPSSSDNYVNDYVNVLSQSTAEYISEKNQTLRDGAEIVVVVTDYIDDDSESVAYRIFNSWKIGDQKKNNGVLLLLVIQEEKFWIMPGAGVEDILSGGVLEEIIMEDLEADFDAGRYDQAVRNTFDSLYEVLAKRYGTQAVSGNSQSKGLSSVFGVFRNMITFMVVVGLFILIIVVIAALPSRRRYRRSRPYYDRRRPPYRPRYGYGPGYQPRPEPRVRPTPSRPSRPSSSRSAGASRGFSGGMARRSSGGGRSRGGGAGRK